MTFHAYTDGASRGNPGESGIGLLLKDEDGRTVMTLGAYIGQATNNVAEYTALITLLKRMNEYPCTRLVVFSDSELMVKQMNGQYKIKNPDIKRCHAEIRGLLSRSPFQFEIRHIPRETNREADQLANAGIETRNRIDG
ncbi:MAG: ribonuclease HI family protein [Ignavibacteria bacterium]|nr:ribonuclease HI family protein [Ignavibacteria bacterium]